MFVLSDHGRAVHLVVSEGTLPGQPEPSRGASTRATFRKLGSAPMTNRGFRPSSKPQMHGLKFGVSGEFVRLYSDDC